MCVLLLNKMTPRANHRYSVFGFTQTHYTLQLVLATELLDYGMFNEGPVLGCSLDIKGSYQL